MRIRILGGGLYGCHLARHFMDLDQYVELHDIAPRLFSGASGAMPARLHCGAHYPRSKVTREACQKHRVEFMSEYSQFTRGVPCNIYAVALDSMLDFGTYRQILLGELQCIDVAVPQDFGVFGVEGAVLTDERHVIVDDMRDYFTQYLGNAVVLNARHDEVVLIDSPEWDLTIDATFCQNDAAGIDRYEVCLTMILEGDTERAITVMDGPFPSLYPWKESESLCSLTSARYTPIEKFATADVARQFRDKLTQRRIDQQASLMVKQMAEYYPAVRDMRIVDHKIAIRAMPASKSDARLIEVVMVGNRAVRIRAGKIDAIFAATRELDRMISLGAFRC